MTEREAAPVRRWLDRLEQFGIRLGLDSIRLIAEEAGHPERCCPVVHVAGTNGKGSVAAMVAHGLTAAGHRTGRYTSPHLIHLEERVAIDGAAVAPHTFDLALTRVRDAVERLRASGALAVEPTYFEATTAAAFEILRDAGVAAAVVEVGLGGRHDATNIVAPLVTAITSVDRDHEAQLGRTLEGIAREKAGIIKAGVPVVVAPIAPEARRVVERVAAGHGAPVVAPAIVRDLVVDRGRTTVTLATPRRDYGPLRLALRGRHQAGNAAVAASVLEAVDAAGIDVPPAAVAEALEGVSWPARLQLVECGARQVLIDGAHNPAGAAALAGYLQETWPGGLPLVFGAMADKALDAMIGTLGPGARPLVLTRAPGRRAADPRELQSIARRVAPAVETVVVDDPAGALQAAWTRAPLAAVAGSLYLAGAILAALRTAPPAEPGAA